jgi:hypothetical protein
MADGVTVPLTGIGDVTAKVATDDTGTPGHVQIIKLAIGTDGSATLVGADAANGLDVDVTRVQGTVTTSPGVAGGGTEATAQRVTIANDSTGVLSVDDNGGSLTVDGTVATTGADGADVTQGAKADAAATTDTGTFTLISLFKRLLSVKLPAGLGQTTKALSLPVVEAYSDTATLTNVASSAANVTLLSLNTARVGATIYNDSTAILYVKFGTTASATSYTIQMAANSYFETPFKYTGRIDGIWASANGNARITELT